MSKLKKFTREVWENADWGPNWNGWECPICGFDLGDPKDCDHSTRELTAHFAKPPIPYNSVEAPE